MATFNIHEAKTNFSKLVDEAAQGKEIIIAKAGKPVAKLVSISGGARKKRPLGKFAGKYNLPDDFFAPMPDEILALFEGRSRSKKKT